MDPLNAFFHFLDSSNCVKLQFSASIAFRPFLFCQTTAAAAAAIFSEVPRQRCNSCFSARASVLHVSKLAGIKTLSKDFLNRFLYYHIRNLINALERLCLLAACMKCMSHPCIMRCLPGHEQAAAAAEACFGAK